MIYLTYNDQPSGVFSSQVNDVCNYLNKRLAIKIKLVAIISLHNFSGNRKKIRGEVPGALVLPALPTARYWHFSCLLFAFICLVTGHRNVISRNVIATKIALFARKFGLVRKVCFDGRGAIAAEWHEYEVVAYREFKESIASWERDAVLKSDFRIAVSEELVKWWREEYGYKGNQHIVIPCTLQSSFNLGVPTHESIQNARQSHGYATDDVIMVYSGSTSGWQSFKTLESILGKILYAGSHYKLIFLSKADESIETMKNKFPGQVNNLWVPHSKVQELLVMCDYGILFREQSITNRVAAPTKFAEYLSAGLPVLISEGIGDYTAFVKKFDCGFILDENTMHIPVKVTTETKTKMIDLVSHHYTKDANLLKYTQLIQSFN